MVSVCISQLQFPTYVRVPFLKGLRNRKFTYVGIDPLAPTNYDVAGSVHVFTASVYKSEMLLVSVSLY